MPKRKTGERPKKANYKKPVSKGGHNEPPPNPVVDAIAYLDAWCAREKGGDWKFNKTRQVYLLRHAYDEDVLPKEHFKKLVRYIAVLPEGPARGKTIEQALVLHDDARSVLKQTKDTAPGAIAVGDASPDEKRLAVVRKRAKKLLKALGAAGRPLSDDEQD
ncbi:hypothetical protein T492DRAFT_1109596 [Pavlovales sp. CCMP2436]|nr:hypothetical protein T492DRAFT_1109596 [Pavlovales sp. CCMP2436]